MKSKFEKRKSHLILFSLLACCISFNSNAEIVLYDKDKTTVSVDAFLSAFYVSTDSDFSDPARIDKKQSRVRIGYIPNWIGFNFSNETESGLKLGARTSFFVSVGDQVDDSKLTESVVDTRQFYGTVGGDWGEVLFGKDFEIFSRTTVFNDVNVMGVGNISQTLGVVDFEFVSFGNLGSGQTFPLPIGQITYRTPTINGFKLALAAVDPSKQARNGGIDSEEDMPRFEAELTYDREWDGGSLTAFLGGTTQESTQLIANGDTIDSTGVNYGFVLRQSGFVLHLSALDGSGIGPLINSQGGFAVNGNGTFEELDVEARLAQVSYTFNKEKLFVSLGKTEQEGATAASANTFDATSFAFGWNHRFNDKLTLLVEYNNFEHEGLEDVKIISTGLELFF